MPPTEHPKRRDAASADETHASKVNIQGVMGALPEKLNECLAALQTGIARCERNLATVARHEKEIKSEDARDHYSQAKAELNQKRSQFLDMRENVYQLVVNMNDALEQTIGELGVEVEPRQGQDSSGKPPKQPEVSKPTTHPPDRKPPGKDAELDGLSQIDLQRHAVSVLGLDPEMVKKATTKQPGQS